MTAVSVVVVPCPACASTVTLEPSEVTVMPDRGVVWWRHCGVRWGMRPRPAVLVSLLLVGASRAVTEADVAAFSRWLSSTDTPQEALL